MMVCDHCHKVPTGKLKKHVPFDYRLIGLKVEDRGSKKGVEREIVKIDLHICDPCITEFNRKLGQFLHAMRTNEHLEMPNDLDKPIGPIETAEIGEDSIPVKTRAETAFANQD